MLMKHSQPTGNAADPPPEVLAAKVYATMRRNLTVVRQRLKRPLTLADKLLLGHLDAPDTQELERGASFLALRPDRVVFQDVLGQSGMLQFMQTGRERVAVPLLPEPIPSGAQRPAVFGWPIPLSPHHL